MSATTQARASVAQRVTRICPCGTTFSRYECVDQRVTYCSRICQSKGMRKYENRKCKVCGKEYRPMRDSAKYCGLKCTARAKESGVGSVLPFPQASPTPAGFDKCNQCAVIVPSRELGAHKRERHSVAC